MMATYWIESDYGQGTTVYFTFLRGQELSNEHQIRSTAALVEDSPKDYEATVRAIAKPVSTARFIGVRMATMPSISSIVGGRMRNQPIVRAPSMILLDLNLPGTDGRQVLATVKSDERLKTIPVLIFTGSRHEDDINACYEAGPIATSRSRSIWKDWHRLFRA